jgi:phosphate transport system substrate-binding protein
LKELVVLLVLGLLLFPCCVNEKKSADLTISGSTTVQPIVTKASEVYAKENPGRRIGVQGGGSGTGIRMVGEGSVAIGASSRELSKSEKTEHPELVVTPIAIDCIAIVVHPSNNLPGLSIQQIRDVFSGKITNYKDLGGPDRPIVLVEREDGSGTRSSFEGFVMNGSDVSAGALQKPASGAIKFTVSSNENAIGYLGIGYLDGKTIKAVMVNGFAPTEENVKSKKYPLSRDLYLLTKGQPTGDAKSFIDFILSDGGQQIVKEEGFVSIN